MFVCVCVCVAGNGFLIIITILHARIAETRESSAFRLSLREPRSSENWFLVVSLTY